MKTIKFLDMEYGRTSVGEVVKFTFPDGAMVYFVEKKGMTFKIPRKLFKNQKDKKYIEFTMSGAELSAMERGLEKAGFGKGVKNGR